MRANSLEQASSHLSFALVFKRCRYSNCLPVASSRTALIEGEMGDFIRRDGRGREELGGRGREERWGVGRVDGREKRRGFVGGSLGGDSLTLGSGDGSTG